MAGIMSYPQVVKLYEDAWELQTLEKELQTKLEEVRKIRSRIEELKLK